MKQTSLIKKIITCAVAGLVVMALLLLLGNGGSIPWLPPPIVFSLAGLSLLISLIFPYIWHYKENAHSLNSIKIYEWLYTLVRYGIAFNLISFGWKKLFGLQFVVPESITSQPMNTVNGEWLTWFYFGHSFPFGIIVAAIQISASFMLLFRKTLLLGAIVLFALMLNITLIDIFYGMNPGALLQAIVGTLGILFLILLEYKKLIEFLWNAPSSLPSFVSLSPFFKNVLRFSVIILSLLFTIYIKTH